MIPRDGVRSGRIGTLPSRRNIIWIKRYIELHAYNIYQNRYNSIGIIDIPTIPYLSFARKKEKRERKERMHEGKGGLGKFVKYECLI